MKLGTLRLENPYILAPMHNVTTAPYRRFCRKFQKIGLVNVPMLYTKRIVKNPKGLEFELSKIEEEKPISIQLIGNDPIALKYSIDYLESYNYDVIDINAGCPSKRAISAKEGGYLLKDLKTLELLIKNSIKYSSKPVSVKIRTGFDNPLNVNEIAKIFNNSGIDFLVIHARTVKNYFYEDKLDLETVKKLKEELTIPVVGNGDISTPYFAKYFVEYTNVDALMIGRETMGNPLIFNQIDDYLREGIYIPFKNCIELMQKNIEFYQKVIKEYISKIYIPISSEEFLFTELKRNSIWLSKGIRNCTNMRYDLSQTKNLKELYLTLETIFNKNGDFLS
jgi:tRNA-dihydrouridine synthase B